MLNAPIESLKSLALKEVSGDSATYVAVIDPIFTIGPKVHGGSVQLLCAQAALTGFADTAGDPAAADGLAPVSVATNFLSAPDPAEVLVNVSVRKRGRRISLVDVEVQQNGRVMVDTSITLGALDTGVGHWSAITQASSTLADMPVEPPAGIMFVHESPMAGLVNWSGVIHAAYDPETMRADGATRPPVYRFWIKPADGDPDDLLAIFACDASAPVVINLGLAGWAPTVQLTTYLRRRPAPGWLRVESRTADVGQDWFDEDHVIIDSTGLVVAHSRQLALVPKGFADMGPAGTS